MPFSRSISQMFLRKLRRKESRQRVEIWIFIAPLIPVVLLAWVSYQSLSNQLTSMALSRRASLAHLSALRIEARLDTLLHVGDYLSTQEPFSDLCQSGKWKEGLTTLDQVVPEFPEIDRIFVTTPDGVVTADFPETEGVIGKNATHREWYAMVSKSWQPCISNVYKRNHDPQYNVFATAIPLKKPSGQVFGILVLQTRVDGISAFSKWQKENDLGKEGFVYVVDRLGNVVSHPRLSNEKDVVNLKQVPVVAKVTEGNKGVEVIYDPVEKEVGIAAYEPVGHTGFGVIAQQPSREAFRLRNEALRELWFVYAAAAALSGLFSFFLVAGLRVLWESEEKFRLTVETTREWIWAIDLHWRVIYSNPALYSILGYFPEEIIGRIMNDFLADSDRNKVTGEFVPQALREATGWTSQRVRYRHKSGEIRVLDSNAVPIFDAHGKLTGFRGASRDVTQFQKAVHLD